MELCLARWVGLHERPIMFIAFWQCVSIYSLGSRTFVRVFACVLFAFVDPLDVYRALNQNW